MVRKLADTIGEGTKKSVESVGEIGKTIIDSGVEVTSAATDIATGTVKTVASGLNRLTGGFLFDDDDDDSWW